MVFDFKKQLGRLLEEIFKTKDAIKKQENIELEISIGRILSKITKTRITYDSVNPVFFKDVLGSLYRFESEVPEEIYNDIEQKIKTLNIEGMEYSKSKDIVTKYQGSKVRIISTFDDNTDFETIKNQTEILDRFGSEKTKVEKKKLLSTVTIFFPKKSYDIRIKISIEEPVIFPNKSSKENYIKEMEKKDPFPYLRRRDRKTYKERDTYLHDFTTVILGKDEKKIFEIEMEIKNFKEMVKSEDGIDEFTKKVSLFESFLPASESFQIE